MVTSTDTGLTWFSLASLHNRWTLAATWRNGEQLLLLVGIPIAAFIAMTRTDLLATDTPALVVTAVIVVLAAGFTSPAISLAFERRYGSLAFLGTTPMPRSAIIAGTLAAITTSTLGALAVVLIAAGLLDGFGDGPSSGLTLGGLTLGGIARLVLSAVLGLCAVVPWAFLVGGTVRSETVLVVANGVFVAAILFGGVLIPAGALPYGALVSWLPTGAMVELAADGTVPSIAVLLAWGLIGSALAVRLFRWR
jgi:ABC-2 type transport system permease protein